MGAPGYMLKALASVLQACTIPEKSIFNLNWIQQTSWDLNLDLQGQEWLQSIDILYIFT